MRRIRHGDQPRVHHYLVLYVQSGLEIGVYVGLEIQYLSRGEDLVLVVTSLKTMLEGKTEKKGVG